MNTIVEMIQKIGIFMLAAQAVIHFAPGQKYEKYMKLIVGIMILLQFVAAVRHLFVGEEANEITGWLDGELLQGWDSLEPEKGISFSTDEALNVEATALSQLENEIKSKLNNSISKEKYEITDVTISLKEKELAMVRIEMQQNEKATETESASDKEKDNIETIKVETIKVEPIVTKNASSEKNISQSREEADKNTVLQFRKQFSEILGIQEEKVEVIVYGNG
ncbi:MAG: stage III sporulation protein AF [Lachnospiraceae bacterium]|nr:stage III sporulation protein AF [Lachnospiraceae bacterium]